MSDLGNTVYQGFLARGLGPVQAAALAGNAQQESSFNPAAWNAQSSAGGLMQWRGSRLHGLQDFAKARGVAPNDLDTQLDYVTNELAGPESKAAAAINAATDVTSANAAVKSYLRYGPAEGGKRLEYSTAFADKGAAMPVPLAAKSATSLDDIFGDGATQPAAVAPSPDTTKALDDIFGTSSAPYAGTNSAKPGTPEYAANAVAAVKAGAAIPDVDPQHRPEAAAPADDVPAWARAFSTGAVESVPVLGPLAERARNALWNDPSAVATREAQDAAAKQEAPGAALAGNVFGEVAPFAFVGPETLAGHALGMAGDYGAGAVGNVFLRGLAGAGSSAALAGADTAARGGDADQIKQNALTAGVIGGVAAPAAHAVGDVVGKGVNAFFGKSAPQAIADAAKEDQLAPGQINQLLQARGAAATPADLGPNLESLAGGLASLPGKPKAIVVNNLTQRAAGAGDRLNADIASNLGVGPRVGALTDQITAQQKAAADPLYDAIRHQPVTMTPDLHFIQSTPTGSQAFTAAAKTMQDQGRGGTGITVGFLDQVKQELDDIAGGHYTNGAKNAGNNARDMARKLTGAVDTQVPGYAQARDAFAGPARVKNAIEQGQLAFSKATSPEDMQAQLAGMSASERDGFLAGAQDAVQNIIRNARTDAQGAKTAFQSSNAQEKLAALIGPDKAKAISDALDREANYTATTGNAVHNSKSAARLAQQKVVDPDTAAIPNKLVAPQTAIGLVADIFGAARKAATGWYRNGQNVRMANMLTGGALSPGDAAAVARAAAPRGSVLPGAAVPLIARDANTPVPGLPDGTGNPFLQWAQPTAGNPFLLNDPGGPNSPVRIVVRGATPVAAQ